MSQYFTQSFRYIHINDRDLPQSFQVPGSIDNTMYTLLLRSPAHAQVLVLGRYTANYYMHTDLISNSAIMSNNFVSLLSDI